MHGFLVHLGGCGWPETTTTTLRSLAMFVTVSVMTGCCVHFLIVAGLGPTIRGPGDKRSQDLELVEVCKNLEFAEIRGRLLQDAEVDGARQASPECATESPRTSRSQEPRVLEFMETWV